MSAVENRAPVAPAQPLGQIQPLRDRGFSNIVTEFFFWLGRFVSMVSMRYYQNACGGAHKVAETVQRVLNNAVVRSKIYSDDGDPEEAQELLFEKAYDLTLMNHLEIRDLRGILLASSLAYENETMLQMLVKAASLARLALTRDELNHLVEDFQARMQPARPAPTVEIPIIDPPIPVQRPDEVAVPVARPDTEANRIARTYPKPSERHANKSGLEPSFSVERLDKRAFKEHLAIDPRRSPNFTAVVALGKYLDTFAPTKLTTLLASLDLMPLLYLYEVTSNHKALLVHAVSMKYEQIEGELERQTFRAYLELYKHGQDVDYGALLDKIRT